MIKISYNPINLPDFKEAMGPKIVRAYPPEATLADAYVKQIEESVKEYSDGLEENEVINLYVILNGGIKVLVQFIGWYNPYMIRITGSLENGSKAYALIHENDLQILIEIVKFEEGVEQQEIEFQYHQ